MRSRFFSLRLAAFLCIAGAAGSGAQGLPSTNSSSTSNGSANTEPYNEAIVVTATGQPVDSSKTGAGVTVITEEAIIRSRATFAADVLRGVPGVDVIESGSPGQVTGVVIRGADYRQVLVLVDGVRVNNPFFGGFDWAHVPVTAIERIEIVRGPYSALYGSDAIGGVIQIFTRKGSRDTQLSLSGELGNHGQKRGALGASGSAGELRWAADGSYRDGDGYFKNDDYTNKFGALRLDVPIAGGRVGAEARISRGDLGIPFNGADPSPLRRAEVEEKIYSIPFSAKLSGGIELVAGVSRVNRKYDFHDPEDPFGFTADRTSSKSDGTNALLRWSGNGHLLTIGYEWNRDQVTDVSSYGVSLDRKKASTRAYFLQDQWDLGKGFTIVTGFRRDDHSVFGATTHPRASIAWVSADGVQRVSWSAGSAFRAPSIGELYIPISGNPDLEPERSKSTEIGYEIRDASGLQTAVRLFGDRTERKIDYDFTTNGFVNLGRTESKGLELTTAAPLATGAQFLLSAMWLDAKDRDTDSRLLRRPRFRGSAKIVWISTYTTGDIRLLYSGRRDDVDAVTFARIEDPSYVRLDAGASFELWTGISPYVRIQNLLGRRYAEVAGFESPGRTWVIGVDCRIR